MDRHWHMREPDGWACPAGMSASWQPAVWDGGGGDCAARPDPKEHPGVCSAGVNAVHRVTSVTVQGTCIFFNFLCNSFYIKYSITYKATQGTGVCAMGVHAICWITHITVKGAELIQCNPSSKFTYKKTISVFKIFSGLLINEWLQLV